MKDDTVLPALAELQKHRQWVAWKYENRGGPKPTKPPVNPHTGGNAKSNDPATWGTHTQALRRAKDDTSLAGVGFMLSADDDYTGGDLDNCMRAGKPKPWARDILNYNETYAEISPSGKGIRFIAQGKIAQAIKSNPASVEVYGTGRYLTITGNHIPGTPDSIAPAPKTLAACQERAERHDTTWRALRHVAPRLVKLLQDCKKLDAETWRRVDANAPERRTEAEQHRETRKETTRKNGSPFRRVNDAALQNLAAWVPRLFPHAKVTERGYRVSSHSLGRKLQEELAITTEGIVDFGVHDTGDEREGKRTPIDLVIEHGTVTDAVAAARWLCERLGLDFDVISQSETKQESYAPVDLWATFDPPPLPRGLLPGTIERFAIKQGEMMGADPAGLAVGALVVCAAAIPDHVMLQPKRHDRGWTESARLWAALVGPPSVVKTPSISQAVRPIARIDARMCRANAEARRRYDSLPPDERKATPPPPQPRLRLDDTTIEAAQEVLRDSPNGLLCVQDELGGWFGSMDKYSGGHRGAMKDRGFWLRAWNGDDYPVNRVGRASFLIPNLSVCVLGGIQPDAIRRVAAEAVDDGLLQRLFPIMLRPATMGKDAPITTEVRRYEELVEQLHESYPEGKVLMFDDGALAIRQQLEQKHLDLMQCEAVNKKLGAHIWKYNGLFARLCVLWHCIEHAEAPLELFELDEPPRVRALPTIVTERTAQRVADFLHTFLFRHALAFYGLLGLSDEHDRLQAVAGYILARELKEVSKRDIQQGDRTMRGLGSKEIENVFAHLEALGWVERILGPRRDSWNWRVNPECHRLYQERGKRETERRKEARETIATLLGGKQRSTTDE